MTSPQLELRTDPGVVWRIGHEPHPFDWTPDRYVNFDGRWDDCDHEFRTLYTADSLLGCFLELLAKHRPHAAVQDEIDEVEDDDGSAAQFPEAKPGDIGYSWLDGRLFGSAAQSGMYCYASHSRTLAAIMKHFPLGKLGIAPDQVDVALLKDANNREVTQAIARWLYDLRYDTAGESPEPDDAAPDRELVDGVEFLSRHGDEIRAWAIFEREDEWPHSTRLSEFSDVEPVTPETPELLQAFDRFGLHWRDRSASI